MVAALLALVLAAWLVAMWAMLRMVFAAFMDPDRRSLLWLLSPSMPLAPYNRKNRRLFASSVFFGVAVVIQCAVGDRLHQTERPSNLPSRQ